MIYNRSSREGEWTFFSKWLRIPIERTFFLGGGGAKRLPRTQTIGNSVCTSRRFAVHKQLAIPYVRRDDFLAELGLASALPEVPK